MRCSRPSSRAANVDAGTMRRVGENLAVTLQAAHVAAADQRPAVGAPTRRRIDLASVDAMLEGLQKD
jgi:hypothetical protein